MVSSTTILRDTLFFLKDYLDGEVTDPITRPTNEKFIMTSYPTRAVTYPIITIKDLNMESRMTLGFQSEASLVIIDMEIRIWANDTKTRDTISDQVFDKLRTNQIGTSGTSQANQLHDLRLLSSVNVDEVDGPKSKVMSFRFIFIAE